MAKTYVKQGLSAYFPDDSYLAFAERDYPEGASQTYPMGSPLKWSSGNLIAWVSPTDGDIVAIGLKAGQNASAGTKQVPVLLAMPNLFLEANFLGAAGIDNTYAAADLGTARDLEYGATILPGSLPGWYIEDAAGDAAVTIIDTKTNYVHPDNTESEAAVGDTNARVLARIIPGVSAWY